MRGFSDPSRWLLLLVLLVVPRLEAAQAYLQASCSMPFPEAMALLQEAIGSHGYRVSRVQHVDKGLRASGYQTGRYRVVFFGRPQQLAMVRAEYPALIPYLPLKITLYEADRQVGASTLQPASLAPFFSRGAARDLLADWQRDVTAIMDSYGRCGDEGD